MLQTTEVKKWFMIHTYSGYEKKVKLDLEQKIETLGMNDIVLEILVPEEEVIEKKRGVEKTVLRKLFPSYVMIEMIVNKEETDEGISFKVDSDAWYVVRNTNGVSGIVGVGTDAIPMEDHEVKNVFRAIGREVQGVVEEPKQKIEIHFAIGDYVELLTGGFQGQDGKVIEIDYERQRAKLEIEMFGRITVVEVEFDAIKNNLD